MAAGCDEGLLNAGYYKYWAPSAQMEQCLEPICNMYSEFGTCLVGQSDLTVPRLTHSKIGSFPMATQNPSVSTKCAEAASAKS